MIVTFQSLHIAVFIYFFEMFHELVKNLQFEEKVGVSNHIFLIKVGVCKRSLKLKEGAMVP